MADPGDESRREHRGARLGGPSGRRPEPDRGERDESDRPERRQQRPEREQQPAARLPPGKQRARPRRRRHRRRRGRARRSRAAGRAPRERPQAPGAPGRTSPPPRRPRVRSPSRAGRRAAPPPSSRRTAPRARPRAIRPGGIAVATGSSTPPPRERFRRRVADAPRSAPASSAADGRRAGLSESARSTSWSIGFGRSGRSSASGARAGLDRTRRVEHRRLPERVPAGKRLPEHHADRPDVGRLRRVLAGEPLRRDVRERAGNVALRRQRLRLGHAGEPEVEQPRRHRVARRRAGRSTA